jgi:hypothetical protein
MNTAGRQRRWQVWPGGIGADAGQFLQLFRRVRQASAVFLDCDTSRFLQAMARRL